MMTNVLLYALPNRNSGGYSVVLNLYEDIIAHKDLYPDIHWYFITGMDGFANTDNITVFNEEWALKSYFHRLYFNLVKVKQFVKKYDIQTVISLNMGVSGLKTPSIISLHNVLPLYHCGKEVFDSKKDMLKQAIINRMIVKSLKKARYIVIPSKWIKRELIIKFGILEDRICISPINTPELEKKYEFDEVGSEGKTELYQFIYPSSGYPYKNHRAIVDASKKLMVAGIKNFKVIFAGDVGNQKTISEIRREIELNDLPIEFSGLLSKKELVKAYKKGALIFPSKIETDGFPILESMSCGGFILAADLDYAKEALEGYTNYKLFNPDDPDKLAELMSELIQGRVVSDNNAKKPDDTDFRTSVIVPLIKNITCQE